MIGGRFADDPAFLQGMLADHLYGLVPVRHLEGHLDVRKATRMREDVPNRYDRLPKHPEVIDVFAHGVVVVELAGFHELRNGDRSDRFTRRHPHHQVVGIERAFLGTEQTDRFVNQHIAVVRDIDLHPEMLLPFYTFGIGRESLRKIKFKCHWIPLQSETSCRTYPRSCPAWLIHGPRHAV